MDLQISLVLLFVLFTGGHSLSCHNCIYESGSCGQTRQCPTESTNCLSETITVNSTTLKVLRCAPPVCQSGSVNLGIGRISSVCCNTDLCNKDAPEHINNTSNGKKCYYCDGQSCSKTVDCSGSEDHCFNTTVSWQGQPTDFKGCASKSICDVPNVIPTVDAITCCSGNLCNGAESITQSFLFLCCSLLSFILLH